ncbi:hypothetical protein [Streptomyces sp. NPDC059743]|uniref:hypothetical protein n=1 Tax=Streptomyces sp. NPDC059743 TaxID=3346928 RepID=UPI00365A804A
MMTSASLVLAAPGVEALEVTCVRLRGRFRAGPAEAQVMEEAVHVLDDRQGGPGKDRPVGQRVSDLDPQDSAVDLSAVNTSGMQQLNHSTK